MRMRATCEAKRPSVCPLASTTYHLRTISPCLGKYVDIGTLPDLKKGCERKPLVDSPDEDARTIRRATTLLPKSLIYRTLRAIVNALFVTVGRKRGVRGVKNRYQSLAALRGWDSRWIPPILTAARLGSQR